MSQSNCPCDNHMLAYFLPQLDEYDFDYADIVLFQCHLCQSAITTMIWIKSTTEEFRYGVSAIININDDNHTVSNPLGSLL